MRTPKHLGAAFAAALALLLLSAPASAFRCGNHLVTTGLHKIEVLERCGLPDLRDSFTLYPGTLKFSQIPAQLVGRIPVVQVEEWLYDLGPQKFRRLLRFENGYVVDIDILRKPLR